MSKLDAWGNEPVICSQGGVPYNNAHIERWRERALAAEAKLAARPAGDVEVGECWQPIETAPKDQPILIIGGGLLSPNIGRWNRDCWSINASILAYYPTHWQPLPAPPVSGSVQSSKRPPVEPTDAMVDAAELKMPQLGRLQIRFLYETMVAARDQSSSSGTKP